MTEPRHPSPRQGQDTIKETFESIVIAFILAFVFRAYVVEAFVIPTGSMAPTLLGRHTRVTCPQCGYRFSTDTPPGYDEELALHGEAVAICPMCHFPNLLARGRRVSAGDRILVHKYIYCFAEPQRWDVIVFKAPHDPDTNFIKRLVGLPNEKLWIIEGNIYTQPLNGNPDEPWRVARKTDRPTVQRAVWQPIYHSRYEPLDTGQASLGRSQHPWTLPWVPNDPQAWDLRGRQGYRYRGGQPGSIRFDFERSRHGGPGMYSYNQLKNYSLSFEPIEDVRVAATFQPEDPSLTARLSTTARLDDPQGRSLRLVARVQGGEAQLLVEDPMTSQTLRSTEPAKIDPFAPGQATKVELWYVDQEASLWVNSKKVARWAFDLPINTVTGREGPDVVPTVQIEVAGCPVVLHDVELDRDIYYTSLNPHGSPARGGFYKRNHEPHGHPVDLTQDQFFCFGDNSPLSHDSRYWTEINPWIQHRYFDADAGMDHVLGIVPRRLIMGKAFFVYFPAPWGLNPSSATIIPNVADMRFIY